ncbi:expressed unknown protein [Seminavis robusta]|uniref:Uncharacterized protein n=1 Tax=Seminavis robusta TaxID=568900 RepID=A0A9N8DY99_9STRA|nr:expressed unknown protein [Seminavis robusta]|eukprot:Sro470_g149500.1 n/a (239) ;mRNA; r:28471-29187
MYWDHQSKAMIENDPSSGDDSQENAISTEPSDSASPETAVLEAEPNQMAPQSSYASTGKAEKAASCEAPSNGNNDQFPFDRSLLSLSVLELRRAWQVKAAFRSFCDLDFESDFMFAHLAIAAKGDLEWAIDRAYKMQRVRREYNVLGTYEEGVKAIRVFLDIAPKTLMSFMYNPRSGRSVLVFDSAVPLQELCHQKNMDITIRGSFYLCYATFPTLQCVHVLATRIYLRWKATVGHRV